MEMENIFNPPHPLNTAVLFMVFNRLDATKQVFEAIRQAKPPRLYIAADGVRETKEGEAEKVKAVREYILSSIDWPCDVKTLFREKNLGCKYAVSSAITWFFENEEMGIILEDDCLPSQSFFWYCEELLEKYKDDKRIWMISGDNFQDGVTRGDGSYYFSVYNHIWGWASWANRWKHYDVELNNIPDDSFLTAIIDKKKSFDYWSIIFKRMKNKEIDTWDYQWCFTIWNNKGISIIPNINMITNVGFGDGATHTGDPESALANRERFELCYIKHPDVIEVDKIADDYSMIKLFSKPSLSSRIFYRIKKLIK